MNQMRRYRIQFPKSGAYDLDQDQAYFYLQEDGEEKKIRFHDYDRIYRLPGLYEQIFYDRLKCTSPRKIATILQAAVEQSTHNFTELRVLDLGAGNGMVGEELKKLGVSRLVGVDIIPEAYEATVRDRPGIYDAFYVEDFCCLEEVLKEDLEGWQLDCLVTVAALGFGDIPTRAFLEAYNLIASDGWVAFNIKQTFFDNSDQTGFSRLIRELIFSDYMDIYYIERYRHRLSVEGEPLYYFAIAGRKNANAPADFLEERGIPS